MADPVVPLPEQPADDVKVSYFVVGICDLCRSGVPGECHVPGCAFWMQPAPGLGRVQMLTLLPAKFEFNEAYADSVWKVERASRG